MAYQTRDKAPRAPLLDRHTQAALERRGQELLGLGLLAGALLAAMMLGSYSPEDPNWLLASDAPTRNWLGTFGASLAHPLMLVVGRAAWALPLALGAWGLRLVLHKAEARARAVFAPIFVAVLAAALAALGPPEGWAQASGQGGLLGDTGLGLVLTVVPLGAWLVALLLAGGAVALGLFALGVTAPEVAAAHRATRMGLVLAYDWALRQGARALVAAHDSWQEGRARLHDALEARAERLAAAREEARRAAEAEVALAEDIARAAALADPAPIRAMPGVMAADAPGGAGRPGPRAAIVRPVGSARAMPPALGEVLARLPRPAEDSEMADEDETASVAEAIEDEASACSFVAGGEGEDEAFATVGPAPPFVAPSFTAPPLVAPPSVVPSRPAPTSFLTTLLRRARGEPDPGAPAASETLAAPSASDAERIQARISDAIRARAQGGPMAIGLRSAAPPRIEPPVAARLLPQRKPLVVETAPTFLRAAPVPARPEAPAEVVVAAPVALASAPRPAPEPAEAPRPAPRPAAPARKPSARPVPDYATPPLDLLADPGAVQRHHLADEALEQNARDLEQVLEDFGVKGEITQVRPGPVVTMYELEPAPGVKASRVIGLADDIARNMSALSARVSTVPGRNVIGIELPNERREKVVLREIITARDFGEPAMRLPLALGKDIGGEPVVANLAKMPHLLIAGTTGSGKSVAINTMILSLLYKLSPEECRLIMIDPKMLELSVYDGIPHLLSPVVTDPRKAVVALKWVVGEMEERYKKMSKMGVRNIDGYNGRVREALAQGETFSRTVQTGFDDETGDPVFEIDEFTPEVIPYIVVVVDEMADLMMTAGKEIEACIQRLAQMARASGIHLIMATQRPSVDVITGIIKANFPTRISFQVTSKIDSRTILGEQGAEQLLGQGDMLYMAGGGRTIRVHGPFCSDEEVEEIVNYLKGFGPPDYVGAVLEEQPEGSDDGEGPAATGTETEDALYDMAVQIVAKDRKCSTSYIQRKLAIGYNKAARLVEQMETQGVVTPANHVGKREILVPEAH